MARRGAVHVVLALGALLVALPFAWELLTSFKTLPETAHVPPVLLPHEWRWDNYRTVFETVPFGRQMLNTVLMTAGRTFGQLLFCSLAAFAFARLEFRFRNALFLAFLSLTMVPAQLFLIPQYQIMSSLGWLNSVQALIVPGMFSALGVFLLRQFFMRIPRELDEAAKLDGCNPLQTYFYVVLPLAKPGLIALGVLTTVWSWNDFLWPLIVNDDPDKMTLSAGLSALQGQYVTDYPVLMAGAVMATLPVIAVFVLLQRQFIAGIATTGSKG
jgi:multiple sugar transport system permease protein